MKEIPIGMPLTGALQRVSISFSSTNHLFSHNTGPSNEVSVLATRATDTHHTLSWRDREGTVRFIVNPLI
jgi:hypothetical protein